MRKKTIVAATDKRSNMAPHLCKVLAVAKYPFIPWALGAHYAGILQIAKHCAFQFEK
jgi:hypothetical protein